MDGRQRILVAAPVSIRCMIGLVVIYWPEMLIVVDVAIHGQVHSMPVKQLLHREAGIAPGAGGRAQVRIIYGTSRWDPLQIQFQAQNEHVQESGAACRMAAFKLGMH